MNRRTIVIWIISLLISIGFAACTCGAKTSPSPGPSGDPLVETNVERNLNPDISDTDVEVLAEGNLQFAFDMYQWLVQGNDNVFFSPYSISAALAMTWAGSDGQTKSDMAGVLHFTLDDPMIHAGFNALDIKFQAIGDDAYVEEGDPFRLNIANSLWLEHERTINPEFLDTVASNYGASLGLLDFISDPEGSRGVVNGWVDERTEGKIPEAVPSGMITPETIMLLVNAIYFNANWAEEFYEGSTSDEPFYRFDGDSVEVQMMHLTESYRYASGDGWQAVSIPYVTPNVSMIVLLPEIERFTEFEESLDAGKFDEIVNDMSRAEVELSLPKFEYDTSYLLKDILTEMGMGSAFIGGFTRMVLDSDDILISQVIHKAFVSVDEEGTEAAAVTVVMMEETMAMPGSEDEPVVFNADHPFIFAIYEHGTGTVLFLGRVLDPS